MRPPVPWLLVALLLAAPTALAADLPVPDDGRVIWESNRDGPSQVYIASANGSGVIKLTTATGHRPMWSPDGRWISYYEDSGALFVMRPDGSAAKMLSPAATPLFWQHDNGGVVVLADGQYQLMDPDAGTSVPLWRASDFPAFAGTTFQPSAMTHDNRYLLVGSHLYMNGYSGANGSFKTGFSAVVVDLLARDKVYFLGNGCWPFTPPSGERIYHVCGDGSCPAYPDIMRLDLGDLETRASYQVELSHPDPDWGHEYNPRVSTDGKWMVYMTSTGCHDGYACDYEVFMHQLGGAPQSRHRVTQNAAFDGYPEMYVGPAWTKSAAPRPLLTPSRLTEHVGASTAPLSRTVKVKNDGGGSLGALSVEVSPAVPWLSAEAGSDGVTLRLTPGAGATRGRQAAVVVVTATGPPALPALRLPVVLIGDQSLPAPSGGAPDAGADGPSGDGSSQATSAAGSRDGCGCVLGGRRSASAGWTLALVAGTALLSRRRRRRSPPYRSPGCTPPPPPAAHRWR